MNEKACTQNAYQSDRKVIRKFYINGRFYSQQLSGVQRYGRELVSALDRQIGLQPSDEEAWYVVTLSGDVDCPEFSEITRLVLPSRFDGHLWEQFELTRATSDGVLVNLGNSGALWRRDQFCVIHDMAPFRYPDFFSGLYGKWHRYLGRHLAKRARLGTVSKFSRGEISEIFNLVSDDIPLLPNGCDHMFDGVEDDTVLDRLSLREHPFFVVLGNQSPHKNIALACAAIAQVPEARLAIVGGGQKQVFSQEMLGEDAPNVCRVGRLEDAEVRSLLAKATGLVFPSLYEGFGIPPLEALAAGCPVISSDIPPVKESCGDAVLYFDPHDADELAGLMRELLGENDARRGERQKIGQARMASLRWDNTAKRLLDICRSWGQPAQ